VGRVEALGQKLRGASHGCCCRGGCPGSSALALDSDNSKIRFWSRIRQRVRASYAAKRRVHRSSSPCVWNLEIFAAGLGGVCLGR
jgi:hypothetical protein